MPETEMTVFERCVEAALLAPYNEHLGQDVAAAITTAVLTALAEHTGSPRTVDEVMRVLGEAGS